MSSPDHIQRLHRAVAPVSSANQLRPSARPAPSRRFRSQAVDDLACILDFNLAVVSWQFAPAALRTGHADHVADFGMLDNSGRRWLLDAPDRILPVPVELLRDVAAQSGLRYRLVAEAEIYDGYRLRNARDLMRYRGHVVPLDDRMRLMAALDEHGSLAFGDCLQVIRFSQPVPTLANLIMQRLLEVELDDALLSPETMVRRIRG